VCVCVCSGEWCSLPPVPLLRALIFSPKGTYILSWERPSQQGDPHNAEGNMVIWEVGAIVTGGERGEALGHRNLGFTRCKEERKSIYSTRNSTCWMLGEYFIFCDSDNQTSIQVLETRNTYCWRYSLNHRWWCNQDIHKHTHTHRAVSLLSPTHLCEPTTCG